MINQVHRGATAAGHTMGGSEDRGTPVRVVRANFSSSLRRRLVLKIQRTRRLKTKKHYWPWPVTPGVRARSTHSGPAKLWAEVSYRGAAPLTPLLWRSFHSRLLLLLLLFYGSTQLPFNSCVPLLVCPFFPTQPHIRKTCESTSEQLASSTREDCVFTTDGLRVRATASCRHEGFSSRRWLARGSQSLGDDLYSNGGHKHKTSRT